MTAAELARLNGEVERLRAVVIVPHDWHYDLDRTMYHGVWRWTCNIGVGSNPMVWHHGEGDTAELAAAAARAALSKGAADGR